jgi:hypothetical protein
MERVGKINAALPADFDSRGSTFAIFLAATNQCAYNESA